MVPLPRPARRTGAGPTTHPPEAFVTRRAVLPAALVLVLLAGCGPVERLVSPDSDPTPAPTSSAGPAPADPQAPVVPSVDDVRTTGTPVEVDGAVVLHVLRTGSALQVGVQPGDDATVLTLDPGDPSAAFDVLLAAPAGAALVPYDDDSLVVLADDGTFVGGMAPPATDPGAEPSRLVALPDGVVRLSVSGRVTAQVGAHALAGTDWGNREGGRSLAVEPTPWARHAGQAGEVGTWTELVRAVPEADSPTMRDQLTCHVLGAPDKATWNLEPWRPDIGLLRTLAARCNAT
jgi:hypothetical protein